MKVKAIATFPQLKEIFVKDDILELESVLREKDVVLHQGYIWRFGKLVKFCEPIIAKKGDYNGYILTTADGRRYPNSTIYGAVGPKKLSEMFIKV
jgi:hypothetical protein